LRDRDLRALDLRDRDRDLRDRDLRALDLRDRDLRDRDRDLPDLDRDLRVLDLRDRDLRDLDRDLRDTDLRDLCVLALRPPACKASVALATRLLTAPESMACSWAVTLRTLASFLPL